MRVHIRLRLIRILGAGERATEISRTFLHKVSRAAARAFLECTLANFGRSGRYRPVPWPPLSESYARRVGRRYATLVLSGRLRRSLRLQFVRAHRTVSVWSVQTDVPYAAFHQFGTSRMPARPFLPVTPAGDLVAPALNRMVRSIQDALRTQI